MSYSRLGRIVSSDSLPTRDPCVTSGQRRKNYALSRRERGLSRCGKGYAKVSTRPGIPCRALLHTFAHLLAYKVA